MTLPRGVGLSLLAVLWSGAAPAHPLHETPVHHRAVSQQPVHQHLANRGGLARLRDWLRDPDEAKRMAAYLLVRARNDEAAWRQLAEQVSQSRIQRSPTEDLALARVAAPEVRNPLVRPIVAQLAFATSAQLDPAEPLRLLAMQTCLMALAWSNSFEALVVLGRALKSDGALSESGRLALLAHPPAPFSQLFSPAVMRSPGWAKLLGESKRGEAIPILRQVMLEGTEEMQLAAAEALLALGDRAMAPLVEVWASAPEAPESFRLLANRKPYAADKLNATSWPVAPESKLFAVWLRAPGTLATRLRASTDRREQYSLLTALLLCHFSRCDAPQVTPEWLRAASAEPNSPLGFAAAALLSRLEQAMLPRTTNSPERTTERAVSWALPYLVADSPLLDAVAEILRHQQPAREGTLLCSGLAHERVHRTMATTWLMTAALSEGVCAPLAAEALATRDSSELRDSLRRLLWSPHPLMRAAVARGLALSLEPSASGVLVARFAREHEPRVRRAIVRALARRKSSLGRQLLLDAARLDPDALVRNLAQRGLDDSSPEGVPGDPLGFATIDAAGTGVEPIALSVIPTDDSRTGAVVIVSGPDGGSMPVPADPMGRVLVPVASEALAVEPYAEPAARLANGGR